MAVAALGSGSTGNSALLRLDALGTRLALIDVGLSMRQTSLRLARFGASINQVGDVVLTHLDGDHFNRSWARCLRDHQIAVHVHRRQASRARSCGVPAELLQVHDDGFSLGEVTIETVELEHDQDGTTGFVLDDGHGRIGWATDLGHVPPAMLERFVDLDLLAIESNYDPDLQRQSSRPEFLKQRIMGGSGHLSNEEALEAALSIAGRSCLRHVLLLHLSAQCNEPGIVQDLWEQQAPQLHGQMVISHHSNPTPLLEVTGHVVTAVQAPATQASLFANS